MSTTKEPVAIEQARINTILECDELENSGWYQNQLLQLEEAKDEVRKVWP